MPRQSSENVLRVEVTLHKEKYMDIIEAMEEFGSQAGFLKFAARYYIQAQLEKETEKPALPVTEEAFPKEEKPAAQIAPLAEATPEQKEAEEPKKRRLPPGFGQSQTRRFEE